jgi:hypothetical protein
MKERFYRIIHRDSNGTETILWKSKRLEDILPSIRNWEGNPNIYMRETGENHFKIEFPDPKPDREYILQYLGKRDWKYEKRIITGDGDHIIDTE